MHTITPATIEVPASAPLVNPLPENIVQRFWVRVDKNGPVQPHVPHLGKCWQWTGKLNPTGYASFSAKLIREQRASRVSWRIHNGDIPVGANALHKCDNRACVNPAHIF